MVDDDENDALEYRMTNTLIFRPDLSAPLTGNEIITAVHPLVMGMPLAVNVDKKPMLGMAAQALRAMFHDPATPFWTGRAMDLLFDGLDIDCSSTDFAAQGTCAVLASGEVQSVRVINETSLKMSLMGGVGFASSFSRAMFSILYAVLCTGQWHLVRSVSRAARHSECRRRRSHGRLRR